MFVSVRFDAYSALETATAACTMMFICTIQNGAKTNSDTHRNPIFVRCSPQYASAVCRVTDRAARLDDFSHETRAICDIMTRKLPYVKKAIFSKARPTRKAYDVVTT